MLRDLAFLPLEVGDRLGSERWVTATARTQEVDPVLKPRPAGGQRPLLLLELRKLPSGVRLVGVHDPSIGRPRAFP